MARVLSWLYIGDCLDAQEFQFERILNLGEPIENFEYDGIKNKHFQMSDYGATDFSDPNFLECVKWLNDSQNESQKENKNKTLVHCTHGINRSATFILYFLMTCKNMTLKDALKLLTSKRKECRPNNMYINKLIALEKNPSISFEDILYIYPNYQMRNERDKLLEEMNFSHLDIDLTGFKKYRGFDGPNIMMNHLKCLAINIRKFSKKDEHFQPWLNKIVQNLRLEYSDINENPCISVIEYDTLKIVINPKYARSERLSGLDLFEMFEDFKNST